MATLCGGRGKRRPRHDGRLSGRALVRGGLAVLALLVGVLFVTVGSAATEDEILYTLTVRFTGTAEASGVADDSSSQHRRLTTYVAQSVRPFAFTRSGSTFRFSTQLRGSLSHIGLGRNSSPNCTWLEFETDRVKRVEGLVSLAGGSRAPLGVDVWWVTEGGKPVLWEAKPCFDRPPAPYDRGETSNLVFRIPSEFQLEKVDWAKRYGKAFTLTHREQLGPKSPGKHLCAGAPLGVATCSVRYEWTLAFTPVEQTKSERWQVDVSGSDRWTLGVVPGVGAGVWVDWTHRTVLELRGGKITSAEGSVAVTRVTPVSEPAGVFTVTSRWKPRPAYRLRTASKRGKVVTLALWPHRNAAYRVDFTIRLAGPQALARLRAAGAPNPDSVYKRLAERGPIALFEVSPVPFRPRLVVTLHPRASSRYTDAFTTELSCPRQRDLDCFRRRGGETVTVTKLS